MIEASYGKFDLLRFTTRVIAWRRNLQWIKEGFLDAEAVDERVVVRNKSKALWRRSYASF